MESLPKAYNAKDYEDDIYRKWEASGYFNPDICIEKGITAKTAPVFSLMVPPPNVTGVLHLGHALEDTLMDIVTRFHRLRGFRTLCLPGTDHAAQATQARVERDLIDSGKYRKPRQELGREELLKIIRQFAEDSKTTILSQIRKMGLSCDWSRLAYTFDEERSRAVNEIFRRMYEDGLIYRGYRVVNWSVFGQSTNSDDELVYSEESAKLYTFRYSKDFPIPISTTRPETKLGDTAVAVHPEDTRYRQYIGKTFTVDVGAAKPLPIKVIAHHAVDPSFGTGALGVTPAHSMVDFEMYEQQKAKGDPIDILPVIGPDGRMTSLAGEKYVGLNVPEAREKFVSYLSENSLLENEEDIVHNVARSHRFKDVIEVLPMLQWFVAVNREVPGRVKTLKDLMRDAVTVGHKGDSTQKVMILPERFQQSYLLWIDNLRDWCISRQIWWGHRIPVWYCRECDKEQKGMGIFSVEKPSSCSQCGATLLVQDLDTLETWFSSGLWTFSTLGWPNETKDIRTYYPTTWMQMGYELLFFWMARMILMSTYALDEIPFQTAYMHGMLRNEEGKKFSKSDKINADPLDCIANYGCDALRLSLISGTTPGNDSRFYTEKIEGMRNFVNKLWNISRFILDQKLDVNGHKSEEQTLADRWICGRFQKLVSEVTKHLEKWEFSQALERIRDFTWSDLADWYLEIAKIEGNKTTILFPMLKNLLILSHPFIPFVTEVIYQRLPDELRAKEFLMIEEWPESKDHESDVNIESNFFLIQEVITMIRCLRAEHKVPPSEKIPIRISAKDEQKLLESFSEIIKRLAKIETITFQTSEQQPSDDIKVVISGVELRIPQSAFSFGAAPQEKIKEHDKLMGYIQKLRSKLENQEFLSNAPTHVIEKERKKLEEAEERARKV
jgi:valyl-tRNA synthetase